MNTEPVSLKLTPRSVENGEIERIHRSYADQLAEILNTDEDIPLEFRSPPDAPPLTTESVLSYIDTWVRERNALFFFIVLEGDVVAGSISLSHIDLQASSARTGYFLATRFQGRGIGTEAFSLMLDVARKNGIKSVSGSVPEANVASRRIWAKHGAIPGAKVDEVTLSLENSI